MQLTRDIDDRILLVRSCRPGCIVVGDAEITSHLLLSPDKLISDWPVPGISSLGAAHLEPLIALSPDLVLLGTGERLVFPDPAVHALLLQKGIGLEIMDTRAACRTYNIVAMEGRSVVAALLQLSVE